MRTTKRQRIYVKPVNPIMIFARGRGWDAWVNFYKENLQRARLTPKPYRLLYICDGHTVEHAETRIVIY